MCCLLACFHHDVNSELEVAERQPFRGGKKKKNPNTWQIKMQVGEGAAEGSAAEDKMFENEKEDGRWRE